MQFTREIKRLTVGILMALAVVALSAAYWAVVGPSTISTRTDNPRRVEAELRVRRGAIFDRDDTQLVSTEVGSDQLVERRYANAAFNSALGYASFRYGVSGAEAAYDAMLRGSDQQPALWERWLGELLHRPQMGSDIQLSFDAQVQQVAANLMTGQRGAIVVVAVPSGQVLGMLSLPTFDPNTLDDDWAALTQSVDKPFFNRALQGVYQPGGMLQTPLAAAALLANQPAEAPITDATQAIRLRDVELTCITPPSMTTLTLRQAYRFGCPYPFASMAQTLGANTVQAAFLTFGLESTRTLEGYTPTVPTVESFPLPGFAINSNNLLSTALGQGNLRITPLNMALLTAALLNDGNAPSPYTLLAVRPPGSSTWEDRSGNQRPALPMTTASIAAQLQAWMRETVAEGAAQAARREGADIGGHVARAYSGQESQVWFTGFVALGGKQGISIAVVLEDSADTALAARIGGQVLAVAAANAIP